jgi:hypothetical protein
MKILEKVKDGDLPIYSLNYFLRNYQNGKKPVKIGIPQGLPISAVLLIFIFDF